jgi:purine-binding chemotaxis protein CheW
VSLVVFVVDGARYAVPLSSAERAFRMVALSPLPGSPRVVLGGINLQGQAVAVVDLRRRFGLPARDYGVATRLLVVRTCRRRLAIAADDVLGVAEVDNEAITPRTSLPGAGPVAGVAALPDGLLIIQDLDAFLTLDEERQLDRALETQA